MSHAQDSKLYSPQPEHEILKRFAGDWEFEKKSVPSDGSEPEKTGSGTVKAELLGDFFVVCRWSGSLSGLEYEAVQTLGYDVERGAYSGAWIDSLMSVQWQLKGSLDAEKKEFVITASGPGADGETTQFRERYRFESADSITVAAEMLQDGKWVGFTSTELTRKKGKKSE